MSKPDDKNRRIKKSDALGLALLLAFLVFSVVQFATDSPLRMARATMDQFRSGSDAKSFWPDLRWKDHDRRGGSPTELRPGPAN